MISFACAGCGAALKVKDELAGKRGQCPRCKKPVSVPAASAAIDELRDAATVLPASKPGLEPVETALRANQPPTDRPSSGGNEASDPSLTDFLTPPQAKDELGRLGPYRILKILGAGGMGVVFQAEDPQLQRLVAIKAMLPALAASGSARQRFLREARAAAAIEHDNIIAILQVGEDRGVPFLAMPFLKGENLEDRLARQKVLPLDQVLRIGKETAEGLSAAHNRGLIHRDIKPANLWLEGERGRVKILDFGLARGETSDQEGLTAAGAVAGTPGYMAPEQVEGQQVDARTDLFSLGVVLYRLSTGALPYPGKTMLQFITSLVAEKVPPPEQLNPQVPAALSRLVMRLLAKNAKDRPAGAREVADALAAISANPEGPSSQVRVHEAVILLEPATAYDEPQRAPGKRRMLPAKKKKPNRPDRTVVLGGILGGVVASALVILLVVLAYRRGHTPAADTAAAVAPPTSAPGESGQGSARLLENVHKAVAAGRTENTEKAGGFGQAFEEVPPDGALLVGVELSYGKWSKFKVIKSIRPIFLGQQGRRMGNVYGSPSQEVQLVEAKAGYAVGAVTVKSAAALDGISLTFMQIGADGLDTSRSYDSDWLGGSGGFGRTLNANGRPVIGVFGHTNVVANGSIAALGLVTALRPTDTPKTSVSPKPETTRNTQTDPKTGSSTPRVDPARPAAEWVISCGGTVKGVALSRTFRARNASELPTRFIRLEEVYLDGCANVSDTGLAALERVTSLKKVILSRTRCGNGGLRHLRTSRKIEVLDLENTLVTDEGLEELKRMSAMKELKLSHLPSLTGTGLNSLRGMPRLELLDLHMSPALSEGFEVFSALAELQELILDDCPKVNDAVLRNLPRNLRRLRLSNTAVSDDGLAALSNLTELSFLGLDNTKITGSGFKSLRQLDKLNHVTIQSARVDDAGLAEIAQLKNLEQLQIHKNPAVTAAAVQRFQAEHPKCRPVGFP